VLFRSLLHPWSVFVTAIDGGASGSDPLLRRC
jgi:hypothetical protein